MDRDAGLEVGGSPSSSTNTRSGSGYVRLERVAGMTCAVATRAESPLKLLLPRTSGGAARVVTSTFGGGLVAGDEIAMRVEMGNGARALLTTQASTKVYKSEAGRTARQSLEARVGEGATLVSWPDPVTCFAGARYEQRQRVELGVGASLCLVDWMTSGRWACGERWAFERYESRIEVLREGRLVLCDALVLEGDVASAARVGRFDCFAVAVLQGPAVAGVARSVLEGIGAEPVVADAKLLAAVSPLGDGAIVRVAGMGAEPVGRFLREQLAGVAEVVGEDPWGRKW